MQTTRTSKDLMRDLPAGVYSRLMRAASSVSPIAVYVFGSYARGEQLPDSDVDLYVVTEDGDGRRGIDNAILVGDELLDMPIAVDILSSHRSEFERRSRSSNAVEGRVAREGVLISALR